MHRRCTSKFLVSGDLSDNISALTDFGGNTSLFHTFERVMLGDIADLGLEVWVDVHAQVVNL
jgi:hypothetical protein